jgi:hypothetical protein
MGQLLALNGHRGMSVFVVMTAPRPMSREEWHRRLDALNAKAEAAGKEYWPGRSQGDFLVADRRQSRRSECAKCQSRPNFATL